MRWGSTFDTCHEAADSVDRFIRKIGHGKPAAVEDGEAVAEGEDFVELAADEEDGGAAGFVGTELVVNEAGGGDVQAAGGVGGDN